MVDGRTITETAKTVEITFGGVKGSPGKSLLSGAIPPTGSVGLDNDFYIEVAAGVLNLYGPKSGGTWPTAVNLLFAWKGLYAGGTTYKLNEAVFSVGSAWISLAGSNIGHTPSSSPSYWSKLTIPGVNYLGAYAGGTSYSIGDGVLQGGSYYISLTNANSGHDPKTSPSYWGLICQGLTFQGVYAGGTTYYLNDMVVSSQGRLFIALGTTVGNAPPSSPTTSTAYWTLVAEKGADGAFSGPGTTVAHKVARFADTSGNILEAGPIIPDIVAKGDIISGSASQTLVKTTVGADGTVLTADANSAGGVKWAASVGGAAMWTDMPGSPTRVSDTQFTITDTSNASLYDLRFKKGKIIQFTCSAVQRRALIISSSYANNTVTINIVGEALAAGFTGMQYCLLRAMFLEIPIAGNLVTGTDVSSAPRLLEDVYPLSVDFYLHVAGTTGNSVIDCNDDGVTLITTKPTIASGNLTSYDNVVTAPSTTIVAGSEITVDVDTACTTPAIDGRVRLWYYPVSWRYA